MFLYPISRSLALLLKQASRVSYFQNFLLPRYLVTLKGDPFHGTFFKKILRKLPKFSSLAPVVAQTNGCSHNPVRTWPIKTRALVFDLEKLGLAFERSFPRVLFSKYFSFRDVRLRQKGTDHFLGTCFKKNIRKLHKLFSFAPPALAKKYSILFDL